MVIVGIIFCFLSLFAFVLSIIPVFKNVLYDYPFYEFSNYIEKSSFWIIFFSVSSSVFAIVSFIRSFVLHIKNINKDPKYILRGDRGKFKLIATVCLTFSCLALFIYFCEFLYVFSNIMAIVAQDGVDYFGNNIRNFLQIF